MNVNVDKNLCIGCGACIAVCSAVFQYSKDGKSEAKPGANPVANENKECAKKAATICPVKAIAVKE